ncbi:MAG: hypothetical protein ACRD4B_02410, partial [Acidobacteriota bacterium]
DRESKNFWVVDPNTGEIYISSFDHEAGRPTDYRKASRKEVEHFKSYMQGNVKEAVTYKRLRDRLNYSHSILAVLGLAGEDVKGPPQPVRYRARRALGKVGLGRRKN